MAVFRIEKTRDYTVMSNHHLRDMSLSLKAKGLLSLMLSLPENWDYTMKGLGGYGESQKSAPAALWKADPSAAYEAHVNQIGYRNTYRPPVLEKPAGFGCICILL